MEQIVNELIKYLNVIETFDKDAGQDAEQLHAYLITLTNYMARANLLMAEYKKKFRDEKKRAYLKLTASSHAQQQYYAPSTAKDFIDSQCGESGFVYDLAERVSRTCVHTVDCIRTIVASLRSEREFSRYN